MPSLIILVLLCVVLWFVLLRPQRRRVRDYKATISAVQVGDRILTTGGIYGDVVAIEGDQMTVAVAPGVELRMAKAAVGRRLDLGVDAPPWSDEQPVEDQEQAVTDHDVDEQTGGHATPGGVETQGALGDDSDGTEGSTATGDQP